MYKILWCLESLPITSKGYGGGGWITSLLNEIRKHDQFHIAIAYYSAQEKQSYHKENITYYPISNKKLSPYSKLKSLFKDYTGWISSEKVHLIALNNIIRIYQPDIIHVWGTESDMGLIAAVTNIPVILHLQGLHNPIRNALIPPGFSKKDFITSINAPKQIIKNINNLNYWEYKSEREIRIFKCCKNYFGRTHFDKTISKLYSPNRKYYYCSEILREPFYETEKWNVPNDSSFKLISVISPPLYKGGDIILKTANILKHTSQQQFEWNIIGIDDLRYLENKYNLKLSDLNIKLLGRKTAIEIKKLELESHLFIHPVYIDNSPNSICEAQMLGLPVISTNVGGIASLIKDGKTGILVPANDPFITAAKIIELTSEQSKLKEISANSQTVANERHNKTNVINSLIQGYKSLLDKA